MSVIDLKVFHSIFERPEVAIDYGRVHYTKGINLEVICRLAYSSHAKRILEIGTALGDTTLRLAQACPCAEVVTVDVDKRIIPSHAKQYREIPEPAQVGKVFQGKPEAARIKQVMIDSKGFDHSSLGTFDFIYIDGLHSYEGVLRDTAKALDMINEGGIIAWDDYKPGEPGVVRLINHINSKVSSICLVSKTRVCFSVLSGNRKKLLTDICNSLLRVSS